jgi:hydroxymethylpyrimidine/phosphomethylpyrimidine kinase
MRGRVLIVAGSDSGGGAGIQADIKTVMALGGYAATAITALTAQDTVTVHRVVAVEPAFVAEQMRVVIDDIGIDAVKTGMLHSAEVIDAVADVLTARAVDVPLVVDPVMVAKGGAKLLDDSARATLQRRLLPMATIVTPNAPEAAVLCGMLAVHDVAGLYEAAETLRAIGVQGALVKGGHVPGATVCDVLADTAGVEMFASPRIDTPHTHGTGCTLASAIATGLAQGLPLRQAVVRARAYVRQAIAAAPGLGHGRGPLDHGITVTAFDDLASSS